MNPDITVLMEELESKLEVLESEISEAKNEALNAKGYADYAQKQAEDAYSCADSCDDRLIEAESSKDYIMSLVQQLRAKLEDPERLESTDLSVQIKIHKNRIIELRRRGYKPTIIADELDISEFLVNQVLTSETS